MRSQKHRLLSGPLGLALLAMAIAALMPLGTARADVGPKPSMTFTLDYQIDPVAIVEGQQIECDDEACEMGEPLEQLGPQGFQCDADGCSSLAYGYADYHQLVITFTDRVRESNVFTKEAFVASYRVTVTETALIVEETSGVTQRCCSGLVATLALEALVASVYLGLFRLPRSTLSWVVLSSVLTLPVVWFVFPQLALPAGWVVGLSEAFAVLAEAGLIHLATRRVVPLRHVATLSLLMNGVSFLAGFLLLG